MGEGKKAKKNPLVADKKYNRYKSQGKHPQKNIVTRKKTSKKQRVKVSSQKNRSLFYRLMIIPVLYIIAVILRVIWSISWRVGLAVGAILAAATFYFYTQLPPIIDLVDVRARGSVTLIDNNGDIFAWRGESFGGQITPKNTSPYLHHAVIATEDKRFYRHFGISPRGIVGAILINLREGRGPFSGNGGSTITQQVSKLLCLGTSYDPTKWKSEAEYEYDCRSGGVWRKIKEVPFALAMEIKYTKEEILTIYLNRAYLGAGSRGFEAAAQRYFAKPTRNVTLAEAAMLAGLLTAPSRFAPTNNLQRAQNRANIVIGLMKEQGYLTTAEAETAKNEPARLSKAAEANAGGAFADWVMEATPSFLSSKTTEDVIIETTLDPAIQAETEKAVTNVFERLVKTGSKAQVAVVVMSANGAVRAMVGGREPGLTGGFNRATQAKRQTGSSFKPFVYAAALDLGYQPNDYIEDSPLTLDIPGSGLWSPKNYDRQYKGMITLTQALSESRNIPTIRLSETIGRDAVRKVATDFGLEANLSQGPALVLGTSEATLLEMTGAFAGILNGGRSVTPYGLEKLRLKTDSEPLMGASGGYGERVISKQAANTLSLMMANVIEEGTGRRARVPGIWAAGKTGTTQAARDAWFIGFTHDYVVGVWMGYDDNTPLQGVTGGGIPAAIWHDVIMGIYNIKEPRNLNGSNALEAQILPNSQKMSEPSQAKSKIEQLLEDLF